MTENDFWAIIVVYSRDGRAAYATVCNTVPGRFNSYSLDNIAPMVKWISRLASDQMFQVRVLMGAPAGRAWLSGIMMVSKTIVGGSIPSARARNVYDVF